MKTTIAVTKTLLTLGAAGVLGCETTGTNQAANKQTAQPIVKSSSPWGNVSGTGWTETRSSDRPRTVAPSAPVASTPSAAPSRNTAASATPAATPTIPANARYTLFCDSYSGPDHVQFATNLRNTLQANSVLKDWYVVHQAGQSLLYHGYYSEFDAKAAGDDNVAKREADRAQRDHQLAESIPNPTARDRKLFPRSIFVPLDAPDPDSPPAWNLTNAPGFWTVQIAAYTGPERKRLAVDSVRAAREMNVPAYYFHGENVSSICIGSWERGAVQEGSVTVAGRTEYQTADGKVVRDDPNAIRDETSEYLVNYTGKPITMTDSSGKKVRSLEAKVRVLDKSMLATLKEYPEHAVDFEVQMVSGIDRRTGKEAKFPRPSMIVMIPHGVPTAPTATAGSGAEPDATLVNPDAQRQDLNSRLRGIGR